MTMIRPETEMKDSGIAWIGKLPKHWKCIKVNYVHEGSNVGESIDREYWSDDEDDTIFYTAGLIPIYTKYEDFPQWKYVKENDLLLSRNGTPYVYLPEKNSVYTDHIIRVSVKDEFDKRFIRYCLQQSIGAVVVDTVSIPTWSMSLWNKQYITYPPLSEQQAIADYLDEKCSKIDEIIAEAKASIEEYVTYKQSIIADVTTNGLNKNVEFCDSGYIWMGKVPSHWELKPLKYVLNERNEKNNPIKSTERLSLSIDKGVTLYAEKTTNLDRFKDDFTAYKLAYEGDLVMNSMNMIVGASGVSDYFGCVSPVYYTYFDNEYDHVTAKYCEYLFRSRMLMRVLHSLGRGIHYIDRGDDRVNTCRLKVSRDDLRSLVLPVPPLDEQREIVQYLMNCDKRIDSLIAEKQSLIEDLESYKKSLIYEVVTGKRRVV